MTCFRFSFPTTLYSGKSSVRRLIDLFECENISKIFVVTDAGVKASSAYSSLADVLEESGVEYHVFSDVLPNPSCEVLSSAINLMKLGRYDAVLGFGGGSSLDVAKALAAMATNPGDILDYEGVGKIKEPSLPLFAVPTTAGTGSECTPATVITDVSRKFKVSIISDYLYPKYAFLDPELVAGLPPAVTAATGMDALTHAIESYVSNQSTPISRALSLESIREISKNLVLSFKVGSDLSCRESMLLASFMSGLAFSQSRLGNVHAISHTFGGIFDIPHGIANAVLLPYVMRFNLESCPELYSDIAMAMGQDVAGVEVYNAGEHAIRAVRNLNDELGIPSTIKELGVDLELLDVMVEDAMRSGNVFVNPRRTTNDDVRKIIECAYYGIL